MVHETENDDYEVDEEAQVSESDQDPNDLNDDDENEDFIGGELDEIHSWQVHRRERDRKGTCRTGRLHRTCFGGGPKVRIAEYN